MTTNTVAPLLTSLALLYASTAVKSRVDKVRDRIRSKIPEFSANSAIPIFAIAYSNDFEDVQWVYNHPECYFWIPKFQEELSSLFPDYDSEKSGKFEAHVDSVMSGLYSAGLASLQDTVQLYNTALQHATGNPELVFISSLEFSKKDNFVSEEPSPPAPLEATIGASQPWTSKVTFSHPLEEANDGALFVHMIQIDNAHKLVSSILNDVLALHPLERLQAWRDRIGAVVAMQLNSKK